MESEKEIEKELKDLDLLSAENEITLNGNSREGIAYIVVVPFASRRDMIDATKYIRSSRKNSSSFSAFSAVGVGEWKIFRGKAMLEELKKMEKRLIDEMMLEQLD
jgi:hypothetical protein